MRRRTPFYFWLAIGLTLAGCRKEEEPAPEPITPVQVAGVATATIHDVVAADAVLYPNDQASITPKINAPVRRFLVNRGDRVTQGQLLAELENRDLIAAATESRGQLALAESNARTTTAAVPEQVTKAQTDVDAGRAQTDAAQKLFDSRQQLFKEGAIARKIVDEAQVALAQARAQLETAQQHLTALQSVGRQEMISSAAAQVDAARGRHETVQAQVGYSEIRSPISGIVADRPLYAGETANAGMPLMTIMDVSSVVARVNLSPMQARNIRVGNPATLTPVDGSAAVAGTVTIVSPAIDPNSTTVQVWVQAANPGARLRVGASVHAAIVAATIEGATVVPKAAILPAEEGGSMVITVDETATANHARVQTGVREGDLVQVLMELQPDATIEGVQPGERVVIVGGLGLEDGAKVRVVKAGEDAPAEPPPDQSKTGGTRKQ
ncbi:MAG: efflux RND transporter periplasmic adaptor subunit [Acidobacteriota bacterium]